MDTGKAPLPPANLGSRPPAPIPPPDRALSPFLPKRSAPSAAAPHSVAPPRVAQMLEMEPLLPQLTELHLNSCGIKALKPSSQPSSSQFRKLSILSLEDNGISDWEDVAPLGRLAALVRLHLEPQPPQGSQAPREPPRRFVRPARSMLSCPPLPSPPLPSPSPPLLPSILPCAPSYSRGLSSFPASPPPHPSLFLPPILLPNCPPPPKHLCIPGELSCAPPPPPPSPPPITTASDTWEALKAMTLGQNQLTEWSSINALGRFPSLGEMRLTGNPLFDNARSGGRFEVTD